MGGWFVNAFPLSNHSLPALRENKRQAEKKEDFNNSLSTIAILKIPSKILCSLCETCSLPT